MFLVTDYDGESEIRVVFLEYNFRPSLFYNLLIICVCMHVIYIPAL